MRRFVEVRPILARRTTPVERLTLGSTQSKCRRPLVSNVGTLTSHRRLLAVFNQRKQVALNTIREQKQIAEQSLVEKTAAWLPLKKKRARAEFNLELAIQAFDAVINNIAVAIALVR